MRICDHCGSHLPPKGKGPPEKYGRSWCRNKKACTNARSRYVHSLTYKASPNGTCHHCGAPCRNAKDKAGNAYCQELECRRAKDRARMKRYTAMKKAEGIDIFAKYREKSYAKTKARIASGELLTARQRYPERTRQADQRRKALKLGATVEEFTHLEIFERDRWLCGICLMPVDPDLKWPNPGFASLDHIIPLTKGGAHSRTNTQCAHLDCNVRKGNRTDTMGRSPSK